MIRKKARKILISVILILITLVVLKSTNNIMIKNMYKKEYSEYVSKYAQEYGVEEELIYAIIKSESNFKEDAVSNKEAKGLMQLMDATAEEVARKNGIEIDNILEPDTNINLGTKYLSNLINKYKCTEIALAAYNAGIGNVDKWIKNGIIKSDGSDIENIPYKETNTYVRKIMRDYKIYKGSISV